MSFMPAFIPSLYLKTTAELLLYTYSNLKAWLKGNNALNSSFNILK